MLHNLPPKKWSRIKKYEEWVQKSHNSEEDWIFHALLLAFVRGDEVISKTDKVNIYIQDTKPTNLTKDDLWFNTINKTWFHWDGSRLEHHFVTNRLFGFTTTTSQYIEFCPNTLQIINQFPQPVSHSIGTGGSTERLFGSARQSPKIFRMCPFTLSIIQSCLYFPEKEDLAGIIYNRLFGLHVPQFANKIDEINMHTLSIISQNPILYTFHSIGGMKNKIFGVDIHHPSGDPHVTELCPNTFASISSLKPTFSAACTGIGGTTNKLFLVVYPQPQDRRLSEVNPNNMNVIKHVALPFHLSSLDGIK